MPGRVSQASSAAAACAPFTSHSHSHQPTRRACLHTENIAEEENEYTTMSRNCITRPDAPSIRSWTSMHKRHGCPAPSHDTFRVGHICKFASSHHPHQPDLGENRKQKTRRRLWDGRLMQGTWTALRGGVPAAALRTAAAASGAPPATCAAASASVASGSRTPLCCRRPIRPSSRSMQAIAAAQRQNASAGASWWVLQWLRCERPHRAELDCTSCTASAAAAAGGCGRLSQSSWLQA